MHGIIGDQKNEKNLQQNYVKKSFKVLKTEFENNANMDKMKRLGFKDLDIVDNETNLDD